MPVGEFFWTNFIRRGKRELGVGDDFDPYRHWDLDLVVINPNMDPHITGIEVLEETDERKVVQTGFGATIERAATCPMPQYVEFETETFEQMDALRFDDPRRPPPLLRGDRRPDQLRGRRAEPRPAVVGRSGQRLRRRLLRLRQRLRAARDDLADHRHGERLFKIAEDPERLASSSSGWAISSSASSRGRSRRRATGCRACTSGATSPTPTACSSRPTTGGDCTSRNSSGSATAIHARRAQDHLPRLRQRLAGLRRHDRGRRGRLQSAGGQGRPRRRRAEAAIRRPLAFNGNIDVRVLATNDRDQIRREVLRKLNAAKGGGYILQSDHSVPYNVDPASYDYVVRLVREHEAVSAARDLRLRKARR